MNGSSTESNHGEAKYWHGVIPLFGVLLLVGAVAKSATALASSGGLLEAGLDLVLLSVPGLVMLYVGLWLPGSTIESGYYPQIVAWTVGGIAVMVVVLGLRVAHPGVEVDYAFGTQAVLLSIGSIAGLGIGVNKAQALTYARTLEDQNEALKRTERQLNEAVTQLEDSNERLEQFAYAASHDLQEPLRMVTRYMELVERRHGDEFDDDCREFVTFAIDGAERMSGMVDGLLEYSRVGTQGDSFDAVDLNAVLDDVLTDLRCRIEETDTTVTREQLPTIEGDRRQLRQLFQNLLSNAIEYGDDDPPQIRVSAEREGSEWTISVRDEGIGIDAEDTDRIFDAFHRLHSIDERAGSGIGLALCQRIVEHHGGDIGVDSEPGEGSTFFFTLTSRAESPEPSGIAAQREKSDVRAGTENRAEGVERVESRITGTN